MNDTVVRLQGATEMGRRLVEVRNIDHLKEHFYPMLLQHAETEKNGPGIALMLVEAYAEYVPDESTDLAQEMRRILPLFVNALADDQDVIAEAKRCIDMSFAM